MAKETGKAYDHSTEIAGSSDEPSPSTEHHEPARGDSERTNELRPEDRKQQDGYGPRTHDQTRTTRKDGA